MTSQYDQVSDQLVLKEDRIFVTTNSVGDIPLGTSLGLYHNDTRYLSLYSLTLEGQEPVLLSASSEHNFMANIQLTNPALGLDGGRTILSNSLSLRRNRLLSGGMRERIGLYNYSSTPVFLRLRIDLGADFRDMFDIRGFPRSRRGTMHEPEMREGLLTLRYTGLDGKERHTSISFDPSPSNFWIEPPETEAQARTLGTIYPGNTAAIKEHIVPWSAHAVWDLYLPPHQPWFMNLSVVPEGEEGPQPAFLFDRDAHQLKRHYQEWSAANLLVTTDNALFNSILDRSLADLRLLIDQVPGGLFPAAGIPWYSVPFGRDSLITALQTLIFNPAIAEGTLRYLARYQGKDINPWRDEQPGKILHELRFGEMAALDEIPHTPYYGSIDATPLFILLFVEAMRWTNPPSGITNDELRVTNDKSQAIRNSSFVTRNSLYADLLPNVMHAIEWIDKYGDLDGDGFVEYQTKSSGGLRNQGWKDIYDSLQFPDGRLPEPPIALVEVQAYVYAAKMGMASLLMQQGDTKTGARLAQEAQVLKERFNSEFWMPQAEFYAQALDGSNQQVPSISSNVGHALYCGIIDKDKAGKVVSRLMAPDMLCGWGIRTLSSYEPSFNPMSYHNGSVWPHDNAIIAAGMARYGFRKEASEVMNQVLEAGIRFKMFRLPELYCGFARDLRYYSVPAEYPVSCSPQAWAAGSIPHFCQTMLGLSPSDDGSLKADPYLPDSITEVSVSGLKLNGRVFSLSITNESGKPRVTLDENLTAPC